MEKELDFHSSSFVIEVVVDRNLTVWFIQCYSTLTLMEIVLVFKQFNVVVGGCLKLTDDRLYNAVRVSCY